MKDSMMTTDDIMFLYDEFHTTFPLMHSTMESMVSSPSYRFKLAGRFWRLFTYEEDKESGKRSDKDKSSEDDSYNNILVFTTGVA